MSDNTIQESVDTVTINGKEYVIDDLTQEVKDRLGLARMWAAERDELQKLRAQKEAEYQQLNRDDIKLQLALSMLGQEIVSLVEAPVAESVE